MKTLRTIGIIAATASALALSSCRKEAAPSIAGEDIIFTAGSESVDGATKTVYTGAVDSNRERIEWQAGDLLRIYCDQTSPKYGDYYVEELFDPDETAPYISKARVREVNGKPLTWGESSEHYFYAACPSPLYGDASAVKSIDKDIVTASIPASQPYLGEVKKDGFSYSVEPDLKNMVMTAMAGPYSSETDQPGYNDVFMSFIPLTTAIRFTITNQTKEPLVLESVSLISASKALNGAFTVDIDDTSTPAAITIGSTTISYSRAYPKCTKSAGGTDTVTIPFDGGVTLPYDEDKSQCGSLTFTFFVQPCDNLDDLTFKIVKHKDGNLCWLSTKLAYANGTGLMFPRHKKSDVTGLLIPEGAIWTVKYAPEIEPWDDEDHGKITPDPELDPDVLVTSWTEGADKAIEMVKYNYTIGIEGETNFDHLGTTLMQDGKSTLNLSSFREYDFQYNNVLWYMEFFNETTRSWELVKNNEPVNGFVTFSLPAERIVSSNNEIICDGDVTMSMSVADATGSEVETSESHTRRLANAVAKGTPDAPYDLSMHTIYGEARARAKTANCYIISAKGTYAFPLVYGNALDDNLAPAGYINVNAYNPGGETDPTVKVLTRFKNYKGQGIRLPYIAEDMAMTTPNCHVSSVEVLWADAEFIPSCQILDATEAAAKHLNTLDEGATPCGYVMFTVNDNIQQGNAVIAVKDQDNKIIWSWHIWITDEEMDLVSFRNYGGQTVKMLPVNLGWVDSDDSDFIYYKGKSVKLRLVQEGSNIVKEFTVVRRPETTAPHVEGTSTYYQWGRKDPFRSGCPTITNTTSTDIAYSIQNPDTFVKGGDRYYNESIGPAGSPIPASYLNLWSALVKDVPTTVSNSTTIKTIYDPCPPGFQIPHGAAYTGFTKTGDNSTTGTDFNVSGSFNKGWYFTTGAGDESNFFPAGGYFNCSEAEAGNGYYWTSVPIGFERKGGSLIFSSSYVNVKDVANQSDGFAVRPVMEQFL